MYNFVVVVYLKIIYIIINFVNNIRFIFFAKRH